MDSELDDQYKNAAAELIDLEIEEVRNCLQLIEKEAKLNGEVTKNHDKGEQLKERLREQMAEESSLRRADFDRIAADLIEEEKEQHKKAEEKQPQIVRIMLRHLHERKNRVRELLEEIADQLANGDRNGEELVQNLESFRAEYTRNEGGIRHILEEYCEWLERLREKQRTTLNRLRDLVNRSDRVRVEHLRRLVALGEKTERERTLREQRQRVRGMLESFKEKRREI